MSATTETLDRIEPAVERAIARARTVPRPARRVVEERWVSSLEPRDLRCLLAAIETTVLPTLLADYAPAAVAPLPERS